MQGQGAWSTSLPAEVAAARLGSLQALGHNSNRDKVLLLRSSEGGGSQPPQNQEGCDLASD